MKDVLLKTELDTRTLIQTNTFGENKVCTMGKGNENKNNMK